MQQRIGNMLRSSLPAIWIAAVVLFISFVPQLRADEHAAARQQ